MPTYDVHGYSAKGNTTVKGPDLELALQLVWGQTSVVMVEVYKDGELLATMERVS